MPPRPLPKSTVATHQCPCCNRKYKKEATLTRHLDTEHYYETRAGNCYVFNLLMKHRIMNLAAEYVQILAGVKDLSDADVTTAEVSVNSARKLLPQVEEVAPQDLHRMCVSQRTFARRLFASSFFVELDKTAAALNNLQGFFNMGLPHTDTNFCPTLVIDFFWHALMQDSELYRKICLASVQSVIPHCVERNEAEDEVRHQYFTDIFAHQRRQPLVVCHYHTTVAPQVDIAGVVAHYRGLATTYEQERTTSLAQAKALREAQEAEEARRHKEAADDLARYRAWLDANGFPTEYGYYGAYQRGLQGPVAKDYAEAANREMRKMSLKSSC